MSVVQGRTSSHVHYLLCSTVWFLTICLFKYFDRYTLPVLLPTQWTSLKMGGGHSSLHAHPNSPGTSGHLCKSIKSSWISWTFPSNFGLVFVAFQSILILNCVVATSKRVSASVLFIPEISKWARGSRNFQKGDSGLLDSHFDKPGVDLGPGRIC